MSVNEEKTTINEEEVVQNETKELVETNKEDKKAEVKAKAKKVLKIAGVAAIGVLGFLLGTKATEKSEYNNSEPIEVEYETEDSDIETQD